MFVRKNRTRLIGSLDRMGHSSLRPSMYLTLSILIPSLAGALPWDRDLARQQSFQANELTRAPAEGTVPIGYKPWRLTTDEAEKTLQNPIEFSKDSVWRGQRLWSANCLTCHGKLGAGDGPVGAQMAAPDLITDLYRGKSDGRNYGVLMNGGSNMPRYGFKFTENERWDVINYLRFLQGRDVEGIARPSN